MVKNPPANAADTGSIPGLKRSPRGGNGNPLQYSCLENPMDGGAWQVMVHGVARSQTRLSDFTFTFTSFEKLLLRYIILFNLNILVFKMDKISTVELTFYENIGALDPMHSNLSFT